MYGSILDVIPKMVVFKGNMLGALSSGFTVGEYNARFVVFINASGFQGRCLHGAAIVWSWYFHYPMSMNY
jgi:hypothetical protein